MYVCIYFKKQQVTAANHVAGSETLQKSCFVPYPTSPVASTIQGFRAETFEEVQVRVRRAGDENKEEVGEPCREKFDRVGTLKKEQYNGKKSYPPVN